MKKAEFLLEQGGIEALGGDAGAIRELYEEAVKERQNGGRDKQAGRDLVRRLKQFADRIERLKALL